MTVLTPTTNGGCGDITMPAQQHRRNEDEQQHQTHYHPGGGYQLPPAQSGNGNGIFRAFLPLWIFLALQAGGGLVWMATVGADVRALTRSMEKIDDRQELLDLKFQRLDKDFARFEERAKHYRLNDDEGG